MPASAQALHTPVRRLPVPHGPHIGFQGPRCSRLCRSVWGTLSQKKSYLQPVGQDILVVLVVCVWVWGGGGGWGG